MFHLPVFFIIQYVSEYSLAAAWSHGNQSAWPAVCNEGHLQSPINIINKNTTSTKLSPFAFNFAFQTPKNATIRNTGYTIEVKILDVDNPPKISEGGLRGEYVLDNIQFRWPSEHTFDNYRFSLEGQFFFYSEQYSSFEEALDYENGIAALSVFYYVVPFFNFFSNEGLRVLAADVPSIATTLHSSVEIHEPIILDSLLPSTRDTFFRYNGSLTIPYCNETVIWTVFLWPSTLLTSEFNSLTKIADEKGYRLERNSRDVQHWNGRQVLKV